MDGDGSGYATVGDLSRRPIPPPKALRQIHRQREDERRELEEAREAEAFEAERQMTLGT